VKAGNEIVLNMLAGESYSHYFAPWAKIGLVDWVPEEPGIYSWHLRITRALRGWLETTARGFVEDLFNQQSLQANVRGTLGLQYVGELERLIEHQGGLAALLPEILVMVPVPLYIGMSTNLHQRLTTHKKQLQNYLRLGSPTKAVGLGIDLDTELESSHFASRLGAFFKRYQLSEPDLLYVRYMVARVDKGGRVSDRPLVEDLRQAEAYSNRVLTPVFGRR